MNKKELIKNLEAALQELKREELESDSKEVIKNSLKEIYFEWYDKIADKELIKLCKDFWSNEFAKLSIPPSNVNEAIMRGFEWVETEQELDFWEDIYKRDDLETNPYIISKWELKERECYYVPDIDRKSLYWKFVWTNNAENNYRLEKNQVCRTKEEAIEKAKKMLNAIK